MRPTQWSSLSCLTAFAFLTLLPALPAGAQTVLAPVVDGILRDGGEFPKDGVPDLIMANVVVQVLDVDRPVGPFEDRGYLEFALPSTEGSLVKAELVLPVYSALGPFPFTIDVFGYSGDGALTFSDFDAGSLLTSFAYSGAHTVRLDVTALVDSLLDAGELFAGFNFQFQVPSPIAVNGPFIAFHSLENPPPAQLLLTFGGGGGGRGGRLDVKPGSPVNPINPKSRGVIPVALLEDGSLSGSVLNLSTVRFGATGTEAAPVRSHREDVDGDGDLDWLFHFRTQDTGIRCGDTAARLTARTVDGIGIEATDTVQTVGCAKEGRQPG